MIELKPCPFCGGKAKFVVCSCMPFENEKGYFRCENMCCEQFYVKTKEEAASDWNWRAEDGKAD